MKLVRLAIFLFLMVPVSALLAQHGIHIKVTGLKSTTAYLGHYMADKTVFCDTASVSAKGDFTFLGDSTLAAGLYFVTTNDTKLFEFVVGENQFFDMETSATDYVKNMRVENDEDNMVFFESLKFNMELYNEAAPLLEAINNKDLTETERRGIQMAINRIKLRSSAYQDEVIENYPATVTASLFKAARALETSVAQTDIAGDSASQQKWYQSHLRLF